MQLYISCINHGYKPGPQLSVNQFSQRSSADLFKTQHATLAARQSAYHAEPVT